MHPRLASLLLLVRHDNEGDDGNKHTRTTTAQGIKKCRSNKNNSWNYECRKCSGWVCLWVTGARDTGRSSSGIVCGIIFSCTLCSSTTTSSVAAVAKSNLCSLRE